MSAGVMKVGGYQGPKSVLTQGLERFCAELGDLPVDRVNNVTELGATARSLFDGIEAGDYQAGYMASGYLTAKVPELAVLDLPFSVADRAQAYAALDGAAGKMLADAVQAKSGYTVLGFWDNGFRHLTNAKHSISEPGACNGLIVRTLDNAIYVETMAAMGFEPVVTDVRELKEAVTSGRVDAQENPLTNSLLFDLHHHHKHVTLTGHFFGVVLFVANSDWFNAQDAATQGIIRDAAKTATAHQRALATAEDERAMTVLAEAGVEVIAPEKQPFRDACAALINRERAKLPNALVDAYLS